MPRERRTLAGKEAERCRGDAGPLRPAQEIEVDREIAGHGLGTTNEIPIPNHGNPAIRMDMVRPGRNVLKPVFEDSGSTSSTLLAALPLQSSGVLRNSEKFESECLTCRKFGVFRTDTTTALGSRTTYTPWSGLSGLVTCGT